MWSTNAPDPESALWWFRVALGDLLAARAVGSDAALPSRHAAFLTQQAAEKALKAVIAFAGTDPPRTHNLLALASVLRRRGIAIGNADDLASLGDGILGRRYPDPGDPALDRSGVADLVARCESILTAVREHLAANGVDVDGVDPA